MSAILILGEPSETFLSQALQKNGSTQYKVIRGDECQNPRDIMLSDIFQWVIREKPLVITFSAGWKGSFDQLGQIFAHVTGRSAESIQYFLFDMGVEVKSLSLTRGLLSIKDLMKSFDFDELNDAQRLRFQILGELIR